MAAIHLRPAGILALDDEFGADGEAAGQIAIGIELLSQGTIAPKSGPLTYSRSFARFPQENGIDAHRMVVSRDITHRIGISPPEQSRVRESGPVDKPCRPNDRAAKKH